MKDKDKTSIQFNRTPEEVLRKRETPLTPEQEMARSRMAALKQQRPPLGGAPPVQVPPLDTQHIDGRTISEQAVILRDPTNALSPVYSPELAMMSKGGPPNQQQPGVLEPVPPGAQSQPGFRPGVGSMYAANQPGVTATPQAQENYKPKLSTESLEGIKALENFRLQAEAQQKQVVADKTLEAKKLEAEMKKTPWDDFDFEALRAFKDKEDWSLLLNPKRRELIEKNLIPMKVEDIILTGEVTQDVGVAPNVFVTYRSIGGDEDLAVKQLMYGEKGGDRYVMDKYTLMQLTLGLVAINNMPLPSHMGADESLDETKFLEKFKKVCKFPIQFLANLGINYTWFDERVRMLFLFESEALKNG